MDLAGLRLRRGERGGLAGVLRGARAGAGTLRLLLDTSVLLWTLIDRSRLRAEAIASIDAPESLVAISAVSAWEIEIKRATGKLKAPNDLEHQLERSRFVPLPITIAHGIAAGALPLRHRDPFDRMLVAQAQLEGLTIVTRDAKIAQYQVAVLPA